MKSQKHVRSHEDSLVSQKSIPPPSGESGEVVKFDEAGMPQLEVWLESETIWLTQAQLAELFGVKLNTINYHIKSILKSGELSAEATIRKIRIVQIEGGRRVARPVDFHNLDMIISLGYRVNSLRATKFRQWATSVLKEYLLRGLVRDRRIRKLEKRMTAAERSIDTIIYTLMPTLPENRGNRRLSVARAVHEPTRSESEGEPIGFHP